MSIDASNQGELVFEDTFETGGWMGFPGLTSMAIGNPAPAMQFPNGTTNMVGKSIPVVFANQAFTASVEVMPIFQTDGTMAMNFLAGGEARQLMTYTVTRSMGAIEARMNDVMIANRDGFRTLRIRMTASGTILEVDGEAFPWLQTPAALTTDMVSLTVFSQTDFRGSFYVDNARVYRGQ